MPNKIPSPQSLWTQLSGQTTFLFILTPPYSGSTALARVLRTAPSTMLLCPNGEGARLIPAMWGPDRWSPTQPVCWSDVRSRWGKVIAARRRKRGAISLVIEKTPTNIVHLDGLRSTFPRHRMLGFNRDPYAFCASVLHRRGVHHPSRQETLHFAARHWLSTSALLRDHIATHQFPWLRYEDFCAHPHEHAAWLGAWLPALRGVDVDHPLQVKDYPPQPIRDQNARQVAHLCPADRALIREHLCTQPELVAFFGYHTDGPSWEHADTSRATPPGVPMPLAAGPASAEAG